MYGIYLYVKDFRLEKNVTLFVYDSIIAVGYKVLIGKLKAVYLVFKPVSIYNVVGLYRSNLLFIELSRYLF